MSCYKDLCLRLCDGGGVPGFQIRTGSLDAGMRGNLAADLDHLIKARECGQEEHLGSMRRHDRLQEHLWALMDLGKERKKSTPEIGVKTRHLVRVAHPEALQGKNPCLFAGLGISDGRTASQAAN